MKKYKINIIALIISTFIVLPSCDFGDTNVDPESLTSVDLKFLLPSAIAQVGFNNGAVASRNPGIVMQYFEGTDAQQLGYTAYIMASDTYNNLWRTGLYGGAMKDLKLIIDQATEQKAPHYRGIAKILMANSLGTATSFFGDIPYSDAFKGSEGNLSPKYDTQEEIFTTIFKLLTDAIADLEGEGGTIVPNPSSDDLVFGGKKSAWIKTAYALQARYYLQMSKKDVANYTKALTALGDAFSSNTDNANVVFESTATGASPLWAFHNDRSNTMVLAAYFKGIMSGDPRYSLILESGTSSGFAPNTFWGAQAAPTVIINYAECKFIEAEVLQATGGSSAAVLATIKTGITANMDEMGVSGSARDIYLSTIKGATLSDVITEKYKGLYPQNVAWNDYRRTGFPAITPDKDSDEGLNPGGAIPRRFIYPVSENDLNKTNLDAAIANQTSDLMNQALWVFQ